MNTALAVANVSKVYEGRAVLDDLTFEVPVGSLSVVIGPNGAGKTTLLEIIGGHRRPTAGTVVVAAQDGGRSNRLGAVLQFAGFDERLAVVEELQRFQAFYEQPRSIEDVLRLCGLEEIARRRIAVLSGGQRRQLDIALALIGDPSILLLDEPMASLDNVERDRIRAVLADLRGTGHTILLTTHDMAETEDLATHVLVLSGGRLLAHGRTPDVLRRVPVEITCRISAGDAAELQAECVELAVSDDGLLRALAHDATAFVVALTHWAEARRSNVSGLRVAPPSLETVLRHL